MSVAAGHGLGQGRAAQEAAVALSGGFFVLLLLLVLGGLALRPEFRWSGPEAQAPDPQRFPVAHAHTAREVELRQRFQQAVAMLHAKRYDYAITALHRVLELAPRMPEAYVNMGFALLGKKRYRAARDFFQAAIDLRPYQDNAYWGLAVALEGLGDLEGAVGAMRTFIHLAPSDPRTESFVRKARAALWEWGSRLKRGPLPEAERRWIAKRSQEWEARNSPDKDAPAPGAALAPASDPGAGRGADRGLGPVSARSSAP